jgi:hypothetical protein
MKYCINCKWHVVADLKPYLCCHGITVNKDPVDGSEYFSESCHTATLARHSDNLCGKDAKYYERIWWKLWAAR